MMPANNAPPPPGTPVDPSLTKYPRLMVLQAELNPQIWGCWLCDGNPSFEQECPATARSERGCEANYEASDVDIAICRRVDQEVAGRSGRGFPRILFFAKRLIGKPNGDGKERIPALGPDLRSRRA